MTIEPILPAASPPSRYNRSLLVVIGTWLGSSAGFYFGYFGGQYAGHPEISLLAGFMLVMGGLFLYKLLERETKKKD